jgi:hypothetical protein
LGRAGQRGRNAALSALYLIGNNMMTKAKELTPVNTGALRGSGYVTLPQGDTVEMGFGGPAKEYAADVHEDLHMSHRVGESKFLEKAINTYPDAAGDFAEFALEAFQRGTSSRGGGNPTAPGGGS